MSQRLSEIRLPVTPPEWEVMEEGTLPIGVSDLEKPAFTQGHEAWVATQTCGHYRPASSVPHLPSAHWVVLRGAGLQDPVRTASKEKH